MGLPPDWDDIERSERPKFVLCCEIERLAKKVWMCKLYYRTYGQRHPILSRTLVEGGRMEAHRVMQLLYELEKIKEEG